MSCILEGIFVRADARNVLADDADSGDESDEADNQFFQANSLSDIASGRCDSFKPAVIRKRIENIRVLRGRGEIRRGTTVQVQARFDKIFAKAWWKVELQVTRNRTRRNTWASNAMPSYSIRDDPEVDNELVFMFLTACKGEGSRNDGTDAEDQHFQMFAEFLKRNSLRLTFQNLLERLGQFGESNQPVSEEVAKQILTRIRNSEFGKPLFVPNFTKYAHHLFPTQVTKIFTTIDSRVLEVLETAIQQEPWVFGYSIILRKRFRMYVNEAKLKAFVETGLLEQMSSVMKDALYIYNALVKITREYGHTYLLVDQTKGNHSLKNNAFYTKTKFVPEPHTVTEWDAAMAYLTEINVATRMVWQGQQIIMLTSNKYSEESIASNLSMVMRREPWIHTDKLDDSVFGEDQEQKQAAHMLASKTVVVLSGKGGCGKTYVVSKVLESMKADNQQGEEASSTPALSEAFRENTTAAKCDSDEKQDEPKEKKETATEEILLTAPTGKAASIIGRRSNLPGYTLHQIIMGYYGYLNRGEEVWKFSNVKVLVCDECSLVPVSVFSNLLDILIKNAKLRHVILLGDVHQLPSIEPGNFLSDIYTALEPHHMSITLQTNHRAESELIVRNADSIARQRMPEYDHSRGFVFVPTGESIPDDSTEYSQDTINSNRLNSLKNVLEVLIKRGPNKAGPYPPLGDHKTHQFIAFRNIDCQQINEVCCRHYNGHNIQDSRSKTVFQTGDKVCIGRNLTVTDLFPGGEEVRLCNGDLYFIVQDIEIKEEDGTKRREMVLDDNMDRMIRVDFNELRRAKMKHAWARTIHTYQGSESETVIYVVGSPVYQNWQHVYTAVTRGRRQVFIVGKEQNLAKAIQWLPIPRKTRLKALLQERLSASNNMLLSHADSQEMLDEIFDMPSVPQGSVPSVPQSPVFSVPQSYMPSVSQSSVPSEPQSSMLSVPQSSMPSVPQSSMPSVPQSSLPQGSMASVPQLSSVPQGTGETQGDQGVQDKDGGSESDSSFMTCDDGLDSETDDEQLEQDSDATADEDTPEDTISKPDMSPTSHLTACSSPLSPSILGSEDIASEEVENEHPTCKRSKYDDDDRGVVYPALSTPQSPSLLDSVDGPWEDQEQSETSSKTPTGAISNPTAEEMTEGGQEDHGVGYTRIVPSSNVPSPDEAVPTHSARRNLSALNSTITPDPIPDQAVEKLDSKDDKADSKSAATHSKENHVPNENELRPIPEEELLEMPPSPEKNSQQGGRLVVITASPEKPKKNEVIKDSVIAGEDGTCHLCSRDIVKGSSIVVSTDDNDETKAHYSCVQKSRSPSLLEQSSPRKRPTPSRPKNSPMRNTPGKASPRLSSSQHRGSPMGGQRPQQQGTGTQFSPGQSPSSQSKIWSYQAKFRGHCKACQKSIAPGNSITKMQINSAVCWVHIECFQES